MNIYTISSDAQKHWHWLKRYIERSIKRNVDGFKAQYVLDRVLASESVFLVIEDDTGVLMVATVNILPEALHVHTMTGENMDKWLSPFNDALMALARAFKKDYLTSISRKGMVKPMADRGWQAKSIVMQRAVT